MHGIMRLFNSVTHVFTKIICNISQIHTIYTLDVKGVALATMENLAWLKTNVHRDALSLNVCNMQDPTVPMDFPFEVWLLPNHFARCALENSSMSSKLWKTVDCI